MPVVAIWKIAYGIPLPSEARAICERSVSPPISCGIFPNAKARSEMPKKITPRRTAMIDIVSAAFFASGFLKAATPSEIASVPVKATEP